MTPFFHRWLVTCSALCAVLALIVMILGFYNRHLEGNLQARQADLSSLQAEVNRGITSERYIKSILQDLVNVSAGKTDVQNLLARYNINVKKSASTPSPTP